MSTLLQRARTSTVDPETEDRAQYSRGALPTWRLNVMRIGYVVMVVGLAITKWPELVAHGPWELTQGTVVTMLVAMSVLALLGLRYPQRMLPILLFEVGWKLLWLGVVALPAVARRQPHRCNTRADRQDPVGGHHHRRRPLAARGTPVPAARGDRWR